MKIYMLDLKFVLPSIQKKIINTKIFLNELVIQEDDKIFKVENELIRLTKIETLLKNLIDSCIFEIELKKYRKLESAILIKNLEETEEGNIFFDWECN